MDENMQELSQEFLENVTLDIEEEPKIQDVSTEAEPVEEFVAADVAEEAKQEADEPQEEVPAVEETVEADEEMVSCESEEAEEAEEASTAAMGDVAAVLAKLQEENRLLTEEINGLEKKIEGFHDVLAKLATSSNATAIQVNQVNENLHRENQKLKDGLYDSMMLPILKDIIEIGSNILLDINRCKKNGDDTVAEELESVLEDVHIALDRHNVEVYQPCEGDIYEPIVQKILKTVTTDDEQKDRTIAEVRGYGYRFIKGESAIVLAPCKVYVYKYDNNKNLGGTENE